jgi:hypothetical protein
MIPDFYPTWAQLNVTLPVAGTQNKERPSEALRDLGYDLGQHPAAEELNWMWHNISEWVQYFNTETIISRDIGNSFQDILEVVDVRDNIQVWVESIGTLSVDEELAHTNISLAYSLNDISEVKTSKVIRAEGKAFCAEFEGVLVPPADSIKFFFEVDGVQAGVLVDSGGAKRLSSPATIIDGAYSFLPASKVGLRLQASGDVEVFLNGDLQIALDSAPISSDSIIKVGFGVDGSSANTVELNVAHNFTHTTTFSTTGYFDSSNNPFGVEVAGVDTLDGRRLSRASEARAGTVRLATEEEILKAQGDGVLTSGGLITAFAGQKNLLAENGFQELPGGLLLQWGFLSTTGPGNNRTIVFTKPFSAPPFNVQFTVRSGDSHSIGNGGHLGQTITASTIAMRISDTYRAAGDGVYWTALGLV